MQGQPGEEPKSSPANGSQALPGSGQIFPVLDIGGGGPSQHIALHGRQDKNAFADRSRHRKDHMPDKTVHVFIQQQVLPLPGQDVYALNPGQPGHLVGINAGGINHYRSRQGTMLSLHCLHSIIFDPDAGDPGVEHELHSVDGSSLRQGQRHFPGRDDAGAGRIKGGCCIRGNVGLPVENFIPAQDGKLRNTVGPPPG